MVEKCYRKIAERFNVSHTSISRILQQYIDSGDHSSRSGQGSNGATTPGQDRFLISISIETIRQLLRENNLQSQPWIIAELV